MSRNSLTIKKWIPLLSESDKCAFIGCKELKQRSKDAFKGIIKLLVLVRRNDTSVLAKCKDLVAVLDVAQNSFSKIFPMLMTHNIISIVDYKKSKWKYILWKHKLQISNTLNQLINEIAPLFISCQNDQFLEVTFKLSNIYNQLYSMDAKFNLKNTMEISSNTCPYFFFPLRKMSITKLLQILTKSRAEMCSHKLIDCLLVTYKFAENADEEDHSDNSSVEIYKALVNHLSPHESPQKCSTVIEIKNNKDNGHFTSITKLMDTEEHNVIKLMDAALKISPKLLGNDGIKKPKTKDEQAKINPKALQKVISYFQEILWVEVGNYLEHVILWWAPSPLGARPPHSSQHLREWINQFTPTADISPCIVSTLVCLADGLGVHVTSTSWDRHFRLALVAKSSKGETGQLFCDMLQDLVELCNLCEVTNDWVVGAPLEELPLVEQIPVLHRLDHSVHTSRLWACNETKKLANAWNMSAFFAITHCDLVNCLAQLSNIRLVDHTLEIEKGGLPVHVEVCAKMREKLVSEVKTNIDKLKETTHECVECLASVCTTISLAHLQMIFPKRSYWSKGSGHYPELHSPYVYKYLEHVLTPVILATDDRIICNMILKLMCQAWLDHIYENKIKFSEHGALQLLNDFAGVIKWIIDCPQLNDVLRNKMLKNEVLRRCEGVGRLLLRNPGEKIKMNESEKYKKKSDSDSPKSSTRELMPAEMYVPNQQQWLELRGTSTKKIHYMFTSLCCSDV